MVLKKARQTGLKAAGSAGDATKMKWKVVSARPAAGSTQATRMYHRIRDDILDGRLPPDAKLQFAALREVYQTGLSPLREALARLASEGLVVLQDQRGFSVAPMSREDLIDLTEMRVMLEGEAVRRALENGDDEWEADLVAAFHRLKAVADKAGPDIATMNVAEWERRHRDFHRVLTAASGSRHLTLVRDHLFDLSERYRRLVRDYVSTNHDPVKEHRLILDMMIARDLRAVERLQNHIRSTTTTVLARATSLA